MHICKNIFNNFGTKRNRNLLGLSLIYSNPMIYRHDIPFYLDSTALFMKELWIFLSATILIVHFLKWYFLIVFCCWSNNRCMDLMREKFSAVNIMSALVLGHKQVLSTWIWELFLLLLLLTVAVTFPFMLIWYLI